LLPYVMSEVEYPVAMNRSLCDVKVCADDMDDYRVEEPIEKLRKEFRAFVEVRE
jgi:hypothetical protein